MASRPFIPYHSELVWRAKQYHLGSIISRTQILPKKTYIEKHKDYPVRISSNICVEGLKVMGSWDEWTSDWEMTKTYNPLKGTFEKYPCLDEASLICPWNPTELINLSSNMVVNFSSMRNTQLFLTLSGHSITASSSMRGLSPPILPHPI